MFRHTNRPLFPKILSIPSYDNGKYVGLRIYQHPLVAVVVVVVVVVVVLVLVEVVVVVIILVAVEVLHPFIPVEAQDI